jgi:hypothetical protein
MILRKDYVKLIQSGKVQVKAEKTKQHNEILNIIFQERNYSDCGTIGFFYIFSENHLQGYLASLYPFEDLPIIQAEDIILDNTVIKVESLEHGNKVIEWWKEQEVDVMGCKGTSIGYYYGIFDGQFQHWKKDYFINDKKIITLPETFTEKWYMPITEDNKEVANEWRKAICTCSKWYVIDSSHVLFSDFRINTESDGSHYCRKQFFDDNKEDYKDYQPITTEQFIQNVYNPWKREKEGRLTFSQSISCVNGNSKRQENKMRTITWQQAQEIIDVACYDWKEKLIEKWAKNIVLREDVHVSDSSYRIMRKACTEDQNKLFDNIFGSDKEDIDLLEGKGIGDRKVFKLGGDDSNCLMANYACGRDQIWLNPIFNWTLEDNILTVSHRD